MKKIITRYLSLTAAIALVYLLTMIIPRTGSAAAPTSGQDMLVDALDAAIVRVIDSGELREIMEPVESYAVYISDCYPSLEETPYPENPVGILAEILENKVIKVGTFITDGLSGSYDVFLPINVEILKAVIAELSKGYNLDPPIEIERVWMLIPSSNLLFANLNRGDFHISDLSGAIGGTATVSGTSQRRRKLARFTCTIESSGWYLQVKENSGYETFQDVVDDSTATICCGMMSQRLVKAYFKDQTINAETVDDLDLCSEGVLDGDYAAYLHFDPAPVKTGLRSINTGLVSGVPLWVAGGPDNATDPGAVEPTCPLTRAINNKKTLDLLRQVRDKRFKNKRALQMVDLYYANAPEISRINAKNRSLERELRDLTLRNIFVTERLLRTGQTFVSRKEIDSLISYLNKLRTKASSKLTTDIDLILRGINNGHFLDTLGVRISQ